MPDTFPSTPGPGRARRSNGLPSQDWGALVDLDPRLSEDLLARLGAAEVAAFVEPAGGLDPLSRAASHPGRPLDRLWVDPQRADAARDVVASEVAELTRLLTETDPGATAHGLVQPVPRTAAARVLAPPQLPGPPVLRPRPGSSPAETSPARATPAEGSPAGGSPAGTSPPDAAEHESSQAGTPAPADPPPSETDPDEAWRRIVEGFHLDDAGPVPPWPASEDIDTPVRRRPPARPTGRPERSGVDPAPPRRRRSDAGQSLPDWIEPEAVEDDGHYTPPPPPPVPRLAPHKALATATLLLGLVLMFVPGLLLQPRTPGVAMLGALVTLGGACAVVYLMRDAPDDSGPDDGAVV